MSFTAKDVMSLRQKTGLGMMDCKKALNETGGDPTAAEEWLRETKKGKMDTRTERTTGEGKICVALNDSSAVIVEVQTETDFTAKNEHFIETVEKIADLALQYPDGEIALTDDMTTLIDDIRITTGENANYARLSAAIRPISIVFHSISHLDWIATVESRLVVVFRQT
jgi:elongation factor Ts